MRNLFYLICILFSFELSAQNLFQNKLKVLGNDSHGRGIIVLDDHSAILNADQNGIVLIKSDSVGNFLWGKKYDVFPLSSYDFPKSDSKVFLTSSDHLLFAGHRWYASILIKADTAGNILFCKRIDGFINSFRETADGGIILSVTGTDTTVGTTVCQIRIIKTDSTGIPVWGRMIEKVDSNNLGSEIIETDDGGYLFYSDSLLVKLDPAGNIIHSYRLNYSAFNGASGFEKVAPDRYVLSLGFNQFSSYSLLCLDSAAGIRWFRETGILQPNDIKKADDSTFMVCCFSSGGAWPGIVMLHLDSSGHSVQNIQYDIAEFISPAGIHPYGNGSYAITGFFHNNDPFDPYECPLLIKTDTNSSWSCNVMSYFAPMNSTSYSVTTFNLNSLSYAPVLGNDSIGISPVQVVIQGLCQPQSVFELEANNTEVEIFPNPFSIGFTSRGLNSQIKAIELYDTLGEKMVSVCCGETYLNCQSLTSGLYFVKIMTDSKTLIRKVVKD